MGTSTSYNPPKGDGWREAKLAVNDIIRNSGSRDSIKNAIKEYYRVVREKEENIYRNRQRTITNTAIKAASFINLVHVQGLTNALKYNRLADLVDKSLDEILIGLIDYFSGNGSLLDEAVVRDSMCELMTETFKDVSDIDEMEKKFKDIDPQDFIIDFIIKCIQKDFLTSFSEKILSKCKNIKQYISIQNSIKEFIKVAIKNKFTTKQIISIDWNGDEATRFITQLYDNTIDIFLAWSDSLD
ncbi:MAG TPA: hypothetical protein VIK77_03320 [Tissierellaceae bacterium]